MNPRTIVCITAALFVFQETSSGNPGNEGALPADSKQLVARLELWEAAERAELEVRVGKKKAEVIAALQIQITKTTKQGDLDGALAIRKKIAELEGGTDSKAAVIGQWLFTYSRNSRSYAFRSDGTFTGQFPHSGKGFSGKWTADGDVVSLVADTDKKAFGTITLAPNGKALLTSGTFQMEGVKSE